MGRPAGPAPLLKQGHLEPVVQDHAQMHVLDLSKLFSQKEDEVT